MGHWRLTNLLKHNALWIPKKKLWACRVSQLSSKTFFPSLINKNGKNNNSLGMYTLQPPTQVLSWSITHHKPGQNGAMPHPQPVFFFAFIAFCSHSSRPLFPANSCRFISAQRVFRCCLDTLVHQSCSAETQKRGKHPCFGYATVATLVFFPYRAAQHEEKSKHCSVA